MTHKLIINFPTRQAMTDWASTNIESGINIFEADSLDPEFTSSVPKNSYVLRNEGAKPEAMRVS